MSNKNKIYEYITFIKIESAKMACSYSKGISVGRDMSFLMDKILFIRSSIRVLESYVGIHQIVRSRKCFVFCLKPCTTSKEICIIVNKLNSLLTC